MSRRAAWLTRRRVAVAEWLARVDQQDHRPVNITRLVHGAVVMGPWCPRCEVPWPCRTWRTAQAHRTATRRRLNRERSRD